LIELGVAGGHGLTNLESRTEQLKKLGIGYEIYGFDTGEGLPAPRDYRDLPYKCGLGNYEMDVEELNAHLDRS
jgi:hypothetical protein